MGKYSITLIPGIKVSLFVDLINIDLSLESSTLSITLILYLGLIEVKWNLVISVANLSARKITWYDEIFMSELNANETRAFK